jgi:hypothetical protein
MAVIETLTPLWLVLAVLAVFAIAFALGWLLGREDRLHLQRNWERAAADYCAVQAKATELRAENADLKRGWQAVRAAVEQHSV